jgi:hypothetical protein
MNPIVLTGLSLVIGFLVVFVGGFLLIIFAGYVTTKLAEWLGVDKEDTYHGL